MQVASSILSPFLCNISFRLNCTAQMLAVIITLSHSCFGICSNGEQMSETALPSLLLNSACYTMVITIHKKI
jgi:hypothetical protein